MDNIKHLYQSNKGTRQKLLSGFCPLRGSPVLKVCAHGAHVRGTKASWGDQKAGGPENLLPLRAEGTSVELTKQCRGQSNSIST